MKYFYPKTLISVILTASLVSGCSKQAPTQNLGPEVDSGTINVTPPALYGFAPKSGLGNTVIKISGKNFDTTPGATVVYINEKLMVINSMTSTEIVTTIPANANSGKIVIASGGLHLCQKTSLR